MYVHMYAYIVVMLYTTICYLDMLYFVYVHVCVCVFVNSKTNMAIPFCKNHNTTLQKKKEKIKYRINSGNF